MLECTQHQIDASFSALFAKRMNWDRTATLAHLNRLRGVNGSARSGSRPRARLAVSGRTRAPGFSAKQSGQDKFFPQRYFMV